MIERERHDNPMSAAERVQRMADWLAGEYRAVVLEARGVPVAYALCRDTPQWNHRHQFFVVRERRRRGVGTRAVALLCDGVFSARRRTVVEAMAWNAAGLELPGVPR